MEKKLTVEQLIELMKNEVLLMPYGDGGNFTEVDEQQECFECSEFKTGEYTFKSVESKRHNSDMWCIYQCNETGQYFKWMKRYNSWDSEPYDLDEMIEVKPVQVTKTEYHKV